MRAMHPIEIAKALKTRTYRRMVRAYKARTPFFRRYPSSGNIDAVEFRTLINRQHRCVYSRIPKAANSTIVATLFVDPQEPLERSLVERVKFGDVAASTLSRADVDEIARDYFKVIVVRNPYTRILSAYHDKITRQIPRNARFRALFGAGATEDIPLDRFLEGLTDHRILMSDGHWMPQIDLLAFPLADYDFVGSVETLSADLAALQERLGLAGKGATMSLIRPAVRPRWGYCRRLRRRSFDGSMTGILRR